MEILTYEQLAALLSENSRQLDEMRKRIAETNEQLKTSSEKTDRQIAATEKQLAETGKYIRNIGKQVGELTDTLGRFAEEQVRPKILHLFYEQGIKLDETYQHVKVAQADKLLLEIDLLLVNTIYSVVVEIKNTLRKQDIDEHLERLAKLQQYPSRLIKGTTMYGAIAGMIIADDVEQYAIKQGLYLIKPKGEGVTITNKRNFVPTSWVIDAPPKG